MSRFISLLMLAAAVTSALHAQASFWDTPEAYLGQTPPTDAPKIFEPEPRTADGMFVMGRVAFSKDGTEFYYAMNDSWESGQHAQMKMMRYANHQWRKPVVLNHGFLSPTLSLDGQTLYMRPVAVKNSMQKVWKSTRTPGGWSDPSPFLEEPYGVYDFMPVASGNAYVGSDPSPDDSKDGITYAFSLLTISSGTPSVKSLGRPINEPGFNGDLYVAPDESYMIVSANETKTYQSELYISLHKPDSTWTAPVSLGPQINDGLAHRWGQFVTPNGKYLFYSHGTSEKDCAIYWVRFDKLLAAIAPSHPGTIGVAVNQMYNEQRSDKRGVFMVRRVEPASAAANAGIQAGDLIVATDGKPVAGITSKEMATQRLGGPAGSSVELSVVQQDGDLKKMMLVRKPYPPHINPPTDQFGYVIPGNWPMDPRYPFPLPWAPSLNHKGFEDVAFAPDFDEVDSPDYHGYLFVWWLNEPDEISAPQLQADIVTYFRGLAEQRGRNNSFTPDLSKVTAQYTASSTVPAATFTGILTLYDRRGQVISLHSEVTTTHCGGGHEAVFFEMSREPRPAPFWNQLDSVRDGFKCKR